jgi:integrase
MAAARSKSPWARATRRSLCEWRAHSPAAKELFASLETALSRPPTVDQVLANLDDLRELKTTNTVDLGGGRSLSYSLETSSNDPAEIAAFHAEAARLQAKQDEQLVAFRQQPVHVPEAMLEYQRKQAEEMERYKAELAAERAAKELATGDAEVEEDLPPFKPSAENKMSLRWAEYVLRSKDNNWDGKRTTKAAERQAEEFMAWWGEDRDIRFITRKTINRFIVHLQTERPMERGPNKGLPAMNVRTVDNYTSVLNTFLKWAQKKGYFPDSRKLPTEGQALMKRKDRLRRKDKANPAHTPSQLAQLFDAEAFASFKLAHHFWPPLITLFTGARRREICQLLTTDFRVVDGIPAMSINIDEDEDKSVKTEAAKRTIPVHPELIAIGLLDYLEDVRRQNLGPELFPGVGVNQYGEKGNATGNAWRRHRKKAGVDNASAPTFHSFRSSAIKVLKDRGVPFEMRCQLVGHDDDHTSKAYDDTPFGVKELFETAIPKFVYEGLDLSGIRYSSGRFERTNAVWAKKVAASEKKIAERETAKAAAKAAEKVAAKVAAR